jgi:hypothetical protein
VRDAALADVDGEVIVIAVADEERPASAIQEVLTLLDRVSSDAAEVIEPADLRHLPCVKRRKSS